MTKIACYTLFTGLITFLFFTSSCQKEPLLESSKENVMANGLLMDFVLVLDSSHIDSTIVDTTIIDDRGEEGFYDLFSNLGASSLGDKKSVKEEQPLDGLIDTNDDDDKEEEQDPPKDEEEDFEEIDGEVSSPIEEGTSATLNEHAVYIHVKWGCNGNNEVIELICEHSSNDEIFSEVEYQWSSTQDFANNITNSNYALLSYVEEEIEPAYNVTLELTNWGYTEVFDFCFILEEDGIVNCGEENNMIQEACDAVALENMPLQFNFKSNKSSCFFFPLQGGPNN